MYNSHFLSPNCDVNSDDSGFFPENALGDGPKNSRIRANLIFYLLKLYLESKYDLRIKQVQDESVVQTSICSTNLQKTQALISDDNCPFWGDWTSGACSKTCGSGKKIVTRYCIQHNEKVDNALCKKEFPAANQEDEKIESCIDETFCQFDRWGQWSDCSETCGGGKKIRYRDCPSNSCIGESSQTELCNTETCLSQWSSWSQTGECSKTEFQFLCFVESSLTLNCS